MGRKKVSRGGNKVRGVVTWSIVAWGLVAWAGCSDAAGPETGRVRVLLTDAPSDMISTAEIWVSHIYLQGGSEEPEGEETDPTGRVDLFLDAENPQIHDLMLLQGGITADLTGEVVVEAGQFHSLRMVVDSAHVTLLPGYAFENGDTEAAFKVPSGAQSGLKVELAEGVLDLAGGETMTITVDFPVDDNFVIQMDQGTGAIREILFTPVLKEKAREEDPA